MESSTKSAPGKGLLKVSGILMIIFGAIALVLAIIAIVAVGALAGVVAGAGGVAASTFVLVFAFLPAILEFVAGIVGVKNCDKLEKANSCLIWAIIIIVAVVINIILSLASFSWINLIGLVLPVLFLIGAIQNKNAAK